MELRDTILGIVSDTLAVPRDEIRDESKLAEIAKDSIALFELLIRFETTLGRHVQYEEIAHIETVGDLIRYIDSLNLDMPTKV